MPKGCLEQPERDKRNFHWKRQRVIGREGKKKSRKDEGTRRQRALWERSWEFGGGLEKVLWVAAIHEIQREKDEGKKEAFRKFSSVL